MATILVSFDLGGQGGSGQGLAGLKSKLRVITIVREKWAIL